MQLIKWYYFAGLIAALVALLGVDEYRIQLYKNDELKSQVNIAHQAHTDTAMREGIENENRKLDNATIDRKLSTLGFLRH